ncbi:MAG: hypothetical protein ACLUEV_06245 [Alistipes sp.]
MEADPQRLESVSQRLDLIYSLQQSTRRIPSKRCSPCRTIKKRLAQLEGSAQAIETLSRRIESYA